jgi:DNA-binding XRE family transcriptional regulator/mRNA-degrading endonuclease RelE of RelBE toxin-antitoxin system
MEMGYSKAAARALVHMPTNTARRIRAKIEQYARDPAGVANNVKRLRGGNEMRLRVGDWRGIFRQDGVVLAIIRIAPRGEAYDWGDEMSVQFIETADGKRLAVLPEEDYRALIEAKEESSDLAAVREFDARLARGEEELIPAQYVNRMIDGENKIRVWREYRGLTVKALAEAAGVTPAYLSQIETGAREGTIETLKKLSAALRVTIDDIA